jgi:hypothetical protein
MVKRGYGFGAGLLLIGWMGLSGAAFGYEEITVTNGGSITGKVTLKGPVPEPRYFPLVLFPFGPYCKKISDGQGNVLLSEFIAGPDGGLQDAIVVVQQVKKGKAFEKIKAEFVSEDCMFHPADVPDDEKFTVQDGKLRHAHPTVGVITNHQPISVVNRDPIIHNGQVFQSERGNIILNFPLPVSTEPRGGVIHLDPGKRIIQMICGMHEFMQTWGYLVDNPYYAKTKKDGAFTIDRLPPGTYKVIAWHPHLKPIEKMVTVSENGAVNLHFEFDADEVKRPHYESQEKFRIGPEALPHQHLKGCQPPYCDEGK